MSIEYCSKHHTMYDTDADHECPLCLEDDRLETENDEPCLTTAEIYSPKPPPPSSWPD